ncbi:MAG: nucleotide sugar dehydrogenase [Dinoroseobacter sp.]|nr:nucleotide sugar dehydrogenase [Dinoroseobacter sp.]
MKIAILGLGYVGFTAACCIASEGREVVGVDPSDDKIDDIAHGRAPFEELGLQQLMDKALANKCLRATKSISDALEGAELAIVCVGTPSSTSGAHDMRFVADVSRQIAQEMAACETRTLTVSFRSTMRPGTTRNLISPIFAQIVGSNWQDRISLVYNPEFLREGTAINDYFNPPKIVVGTRDAAPSQIMEDLHQNIDAPIFTVGYEEAEITKFVDNSWHAVKVTFANEIGRVCEKLGVSASKVHEIFVSDTKLNISPYYTRPGGAFGGSCLPKDVRALSFIANDVNANTHLVDSLIRSNEAHKNHQIDAILKRLPKSTSAQVLMAGLAFKADTDDLRESPNVDLARKLLELGHDLKVFDPHLDPSRLKGQNLSHVYSALPSIGELLISKEEAEAGTWDLVIASNATADRLTLANSPVYATHSIQ